MVVEKCLGTRCLTFFEMQSIKTYLVYNDFLVFFYSSRTFFRGLLLFPFEQHTVLRKSSLNTIYSNAYVTILLANSNRKKLEVGHVNRRVCVRQTLKHHIKCLLTLFLVTHCLATLTLCLSTLCLYQQNTYLCLSYYPNGFEC